MNPHFPPLSGHIPGQPILSIPRPNRHGKRQLPFGFVPDNTAILCGRGKTCTSSPGNKRMKSIVKSHINDYSNAKNKAEKTAVVNMIMETIQGKNKEKGLFVRQHEGIWWEVEDTVAREKVGCMIRDGLHTQYRSSSRAKFLKKRNAQMTEDRGRESKASSDQDSDAFKPHSLLQGGGTNSAMMPSTFLPDLFSLSGVPTNTQSINPPISYLPPNPQASNMSSMQTNMFNQGFSNHSLAPFSERIESGGPDDVLRARRSQDATIVATEKMSSRDRKKKGEALVSSKEHTITGAVTSGGDGLDEDGSSPDSSSWGLRSRGRGYLQQARHVIGDDGIDGNLPDDLSGIFDD